MDGDPQSKAPHYRQSGVVFLLIGLAFLLLAAHTLLNWPWLFFAFWAVIAAAVVYAVASSIKSELHP